MKNLSQGVRQSRYQSLPVSANDTNTDSLFRHDREEEEEEEDDDEEDDDEEDDDEEDDDEEEVESDVGSLCFISCIFVHKIILK